MDASIDGGALDANPPDAGHFDIPPAPPLCHVGQSCDCRATDLLPAGRFVVGLDRGPDESCGQAITDPGGGEYTGCFAHWVRLTQDHHMARHEGTSGCFARCVREGACRVDDALECDARAGRGDCGNISSAYWRAPEHARMPITGLIYDGAVRYCAWLGGRIPTNAEWEFAARGPGGRVWPWWPDMTGRFFLADPQDWSRMQEFVVDSPYMHLPALIRVPARNPTVVMDVGSFPLGAGPFGALDIAGNAVEWVQDGPTLGYPRAEQTDPLAATDPGYFGVPGDEIYSDDVHMVRGGLPNPMQHQVVARAPDSPVYAERWFDGIHVPIGVRCIFDAKPDPLAMWETMTIVQDGTSSAP